MTEAHVHRDDAEALAAQHHLVQVRLEEAQAACGPSVWPRVEALVTALVDLYGAGLERLLDVAMVTARSRGEVEARIVDDEIVASLLVLHDLHPTASAPAQRPASASALVPAEHLVRRGARP